MIPFYHSHSPLSGTITHNIHPVTIDFPKFYVQVLNLKPPKFSKMIFLHILLAIKPVIAAYQHHINSTIECPDVVSFCPFKPPTTTFCLHFTFTSSILFHQLCHPPVCSSYSSLPVILTQTSEYHLPKHQINKQQIPGYCKIYF